MEYSVLRAIKSGLMFLVVIVMTTTASTQDIHFSQFYMSPLTLNPAMTGVMNCNNRFIANYRNQWASVLKSNAYNTYAVSYDHKVPVGQYDNFGIGGSFYGDVAGQLNFGTMKAAVSGSFSKKMFGNRRNSHYMVAGTSLGYAFRTIDFTQARWGLQHDNNGGFDPTLPTGEEGKLYQDNLSFVDLNVGLLWFSVLNKDNNVYLGVAYDHLNQPNIAFEEGTTIPLYGKYTIHAGGEINFNRQYSILPGIVLLSQGPSFEVNGGTSLRFLFGPRDAQQSVQFGLWARLANHYEKSILMDAIILSTRFDYNQFGLGFSYDINTSPLHQASGSNGSFEFSLIYKLCGAENRGVYCPEF